jgi:hypothetical protein
MHVDDSNGGLLGAARGVVAQGRRGTGQRGTGLSARAQLSRRQQQHGMVGSRLGSEAMSHGPGPQQPGLDAEDWSRADAEHRRLVRESVATHAAAQAAPGRAPAVGPAGGTVTPEARLTRSRDERIGLAPPPPLERRRR